MRLANAMIRAMIRTGAVLVVAACTTRAPVVAPAPVQLMAPLPPAQVVQRAAQRLVTDGFTVATSDATGGSLTATLTRQGEGSWGPYLTCRFADDAIAHTRGRATLTVRVAAASTGTASQVVITSSASNTVSAGRTLSSQSDTSCTSTGEAERVVADALRAP
jgi:hypothetical protein